MEINKSILMGVKISYRSNAGHPEMVINGVPLSQIIGPYTHAEVKEDKMGMPIIKIEIPLYRMAEKAENYKEGAE